jgi:dihydrolipoamide dehydrogenase
MDAKLLIVGGGPGGYVAAIRAAQLGVSTVLVENGKLGGACLNVGCIPSKALIHVANEFAQVVNHSNASALGIRVENPSIDFAASQRWKDSITTKLAGGVGALLKKAGVRVVKGTARILDGKTIEVDGVEGEALRIHCDHLLLATGSRPAELPGLPFGGLVIDSTEALALSSPPRNLVVVGGGYIGLELGIAYRKLGSDVDIVESASRILPSYDEDLTKPVLASLNRLGIRVYTRTKALDLTGSGDGLRVCTDVGEKIVLSADKVLVAVGRHPSTQGFNLESLNLSMDGRFLQIDKQCRTSMRNVWAIGDVTGDPMLAHRAMAQGHMVAEIIAGQRREFTPAVIPAVCFTDPEIVSVGLSPSDAEYAAGDFQVSSFPLAANGRAMTMEATEGFIRVVARSDDHTIKGWQAVGSGVSELSAAFSYTIEMGARLEDVGSIIHAHPTLGETLQEAALRMLGQAIHI